MLVPKSVLQEFVARFDIPSCTPCPVDHPVKKEIPSYLFVVGGARLSYVLRVFPRKYPRKRMTAMAEALSHLAASSVAAPRLRLTRDGTVSAMADEHRAVCTTYLPGEIASKRITHADMAEQRRIAVSAGGCLGDIHQALRTKPHQGHPGEKDYRTPRQIMACVAKAGARSGHRALARLRVACEDLLDCWSPDLHSREAVLWSHGDARLDNVVVDRGSVAMIDFELSGCTSASYDLAKLITSTPETLIYWEEISAAYQNHYHGPAPTDQLLNGIRSQLAWRMARSSCPPSSPASRRWVVRMLDTMRLIPELCR
jgi:Ser/Thr protein kinase RdoA (MazF antagonist)